ncbi:uncharacterized protein MICPUCDRAFT_54474 [Micromonas pusilla CCMP1545]|jgi:hypothetical protein|uniref:Predicted protein n=1 Tax=Micromonas pusilla (strain CCMP1545) TaxID=564608 RepID=C1N9E3_MICPC|nr:uncharacterized protein MICPUCDRAFT_54474 [Micromonas pusilla CCMP1545]EEH51341.1 predicted protein [Micromonas pusilla CCMP1545]|eukprot:XP_003064436.1 predicted protein [Micromonas pusilla CCMP1545]
MPGVLLHHETSMKDSYHDYLTPWTHYVPVRNDLSDLREKVEWCEANDAKAREISANGAKFVEAFRTPEVRSIRWFPYDRVGVVNADP